MTILYFELQLSYCRGLPYSKFDPGCSMGAWLEIKKLGPLPDVLSYTLQFNEIPGDLKFENIKVWVIVP